MSKVIRLAREADSSRLLEIYAPYIINTPITFEYDVPKISEFKDRVTATLMKLPWLVYEDGGIIKGYAYASEHRKRPAYDWSVDLSIYIDEEYQREGIGRALYGSLIDILRIQGYFNAFAGVTIPNIKSEGFHKSFGFIPIGIYKNVGYKFDRWYDTKWYQYMIKEHSFKPETIKSIKEIESSDEYRKIINYYL